MILFSLSLSPFLPYSLSLSLSFCLVINQLIDISPYFSLSTSSLSSQSRQHELFQGLVFLLSVCQTSEWFLSLHVPIVINLVVSDDLCAPTIAHQMPSTFLNEDVFAPCSTLWSSCHDHFSQFEGNYLQAKKPTESTRIFLLLKKIVPLRFLTSVMKIHTRIKSF